MYRPGDRSATRGEWARREHPQVWCPIREGPIRRPANSPCPVAHALIRNAGLTRPWSVLLDDDRRRGAARRHVPVPSSGGPLTHLDHSICPVSPGREEPITPPTTTCRRT